MSVPVHTPPSPPEVKYDNDFSLGPYYAHYWSLVGGTIEHDGVPIAANGSYISPYGSSAPPSEPFFTVQDPELPVLEDVPWQANCGDSLFTHSRSTSYAPVTETSPYTPPMDGSVWNHYGSQDATLQLQSLPSLENLANQILNTLLSGTTHDFIDTISSPHSSDKGQAYATVEALFEQQKRLFTRGRIFIETNNLHMGSPAFLRVARKSNLATFVSLIFRGQDIPFLELDQHFLDLFMPNGSRLLKAEGNMWLELKTQAYISMMMNGANRDDLLEKLFPRDLQNAITRRRPEPTHLAPNEIDFLNRIANRRDKLANWPADVSSLSQLSQMYAWNDFLQEVWNTVRKAIDHLESSKDMHHLMSSSMTDDPITKATIAAHAAISGHSRSYSASSTHSLAPSISTYQPLPAYNFADSPTSIASGRSFRSSAPASASPTTPTNSTSLPLSYPRTTSHPSNKALSGARRPNAPSPRRPWTSEEEKALLDGLERVKGPHWSQILALYGPGGSISEVLKDRNQVQLKDKARNLKLFFLKSGVEVPGYLKRVTGELRTRAPGQAARRERERRREEEERQQRDSKLVV
ncbi:hypothetical protein BT63DRAFT_456980 [Microthyrium microscopicum]|uniref:HTH myb-type domain-containing protein n=1 Tax=Microthyrium microscopicum TaxID=703497 RepID=A0A6A6U610_9PEZI|nr:hypothetical protein BT63DRAFT_456980 [Microthyrium microscopicum]